MAKAYDIMYLEDAMSSIGAMMDYAVNSCGEELSSFYGRFISSGIASMIFCANPRYIAGCSGVELAETVARRTGKELHKAEPLIDIGSPEYWAGWTLAYISWFLSMDFEVLHVRGVGIEDIHRRYPTLHEADLSKSVNFARSRIEQYLRCNNPLKTARTTAGMTQKELAEASGISLRSIRAYEQGQLSLRNAESETASTLSRILGCPASLLI